MCIERQRGLTLVELIIAIVIVGICIAGVIGLYTNVVRGSAQPMQIKQAMAIAEALMEEVQLAPFTYCDANDPLAEVAQNVGQCTAGFVPPAAARPFDHVLKYNGLTMNNGIVDVNGLPIPGLAAYGAAVAVVPAALSGITVASGDAVLITVTVTTPNGDAYTLDGYRSRYAPNALP